MKCRYIFRFFAIILVLSSLKLSADPIVWRIQSGKPIQHSGFKLERAFSEKVALLTDGQLQIELRPANGYVATRSVFNAVRTGKIDGMIVLSSYWENADPVFAIMGDLVAAWDSPEEYAHWLDKREGTRYLQQAYAAYGLKFIDYFLSPLESLVSVHPITGIEDVNGKVMRSPPGMSMQYFTALGASVRNISLPQVKAALNKKQITLTDFSDITSNHKVGLYAIAKHTNYPGFHSMPLASFTISQSAWNMLTLFQQQAVLTATADLKQQYSDSYYSALKPALEEIKAAGVSIYSWDQDQRVEARRLAVPIWLKYAQKSATAKQLIIDLMAYLKEIGNI